MLIKSYQGQTLEITDQGVTITKPVFKSTFSVDFDGIRGHVLVKPGFLKAGSLGILCEGHDMHTARNVVGPNVIMFDSSRTEEFESVARMILEKRGVPADV